MDARISNLLKKQPPRKRTKWNKEFMGAIRDLGEFKNDKDLSKQARGNI